MINDDLQNTGIYRAILIDYNDELRIYTPGLSSFHDFDINNIEHIKKYISSLSKPMWNVPNLEAMKHEIPTHPCWVTFENGNINKPIIMGWLGKGIMYSAAVSNNGTNNSNPNPNPPPMKVDFTQLNKDLQEIFKDYENNCNVSYYIQDLKTGDSCEYNGSSSLPSASVIKIFVAAKIYDMINNGKITQDSVNDDLKKMLGASDNISANKLIDICDETGKENKGINTTAYNNINNYAKQLGATGTKVNTYYGYGDYTTSTPEAGQYTCLFTSCKDCAILLKKLYDSSFISSTISTDFCSKLKEASTGEDAKFRTSSNKSKVTFIDKSGETTIIDNHVAIVKHNDVSDKNKHDYIICLMVSAKTEASPYNQAEVRSKFKTFFDKVYDFMCSPKGAVDMLDGVTEYSKSKDANTQLSTHFKVSDFACGCGCDMIKISKDLVAMLENVWAYFNSTVGINSAYRCKNRNDAVGGAENSNHLRGLAADIVVENKLVADVYNYINSIMPNSGELGPYYGKGFVHVAPAGKYSRFTGD